MGKVTPAQGVRAGLAGLREQVVTQRRPYPMYFVSPRVALPTCLLKQSSFRQPAAIDGQNMSGDK